MQTAVTIHIVQGERTMASDNVSLGMFNLVGIPPAPRGIPQIEVTFDIDANGILNVSAQDKGSGKSQSISITATNKLSKEEVEKMKKQAEEFAEQDKKKKEEIEKLNTAETLAYTVEKTVNDAKDKIDEKTRKDILDEVKQLRDAITAKDVSKVDTLSESLSKKIQEVGAKMYQSSTPPPGPEQEQSQQSSGAEGAQSEGQASAGQDQKVYDTSYKEQ